MASETQKHSLHPRGHLACKGGQGARAFFPLPRGGEKQVLGLNSNSRGPYRLGQGFGFGACKIQASI